MDYTLTRIDPNGENDRYPLQKQEIVTDPLEQEVNKSVYMGKLEHAMHDMVNWGRKNSCLLYTSPSPRDRQKSRMPSSA